MTAAPSLANDMGTTPYFASQCLGRRLVSPSPNISRRIRGRILAASTTNSRSDCALAIGAGTHGEAP